MSISSGDIRDQSQKLSEIAPNFGRFSLPKFMGPAFQKLYPFYHPYLTARRLESFVRILPLAPKFYLFIRWILSQILNFLD